MQTFHLRIRAEWGFPKDERCALATKVMLQASVLRILIFSINIMLIYDGINFCVIKINIKRKGCQVPPL